MDGFRRGIAVRIEARSPAARGVFLAAIEPVTGQRFATQNSLRRMHARPVQDTFDKILFTALSQTVREPRHPGKRCQALGEKEGLLRPMSAFVVDLVSRTACPRAPDQAPQASRLAP